MMRFVCRLLGALAATTAAGGEYVLPSASDREQALGDIQSVPTAWRKFLTPDADFVPLGAPRPGDWLSMHEEKGESFEVFRTVYVRRPDAKRRTIYLQPIGQFRSDASPPIQEIRTYTAAFYQMEVKVLPTFTPPDTQFEPRENPLSHQRQIRSSEVIKFLSERLPADGYCLLGITMADLYPEPSWNYVFGQASPSGRAGVFSFARNDPAFFRETRSADYKRVIIDRSCKTLVHEIGHLFGMAHCIYYNCVMNGSNSMAEADSAPNHACPVCLRKIQFAIEFDPVKRYRDLARFYQRNRWSEELGWVNRQLSK